MSTVRRPRPSAPLAGVAAFLTGYAITYLVAAGPIRRSAARRLFQALTDAGATWKLVGWAFYGAHFVETVVPGLFGTTTTVNLVGETGLPDALYLVPPVVLLAAGAVATVAAGARTLRDGAVAGGAVTLGYLPLALLGTFVVTVEVGGPARPDLLPALLLAGVLYPLVFGAAGGALLGRLRPATGRR